MEKEIKEGVIIWSWIGITNSGGPITESDGVATYIRIAYV